MSLLYSSEYCNLQKWAHPQKYAHPPFLNEVIAKNVYFSLCSLICAVMLSKKCQSSITMKRRDKADIIYCYCISKYMTKGGTAEFIATCVHKFDCMQVEHNFDRNITSLKNTPMHPVLRSYFKLMSYGHIFERLQYDIKSMILH